jgi:hypothetical protein
LYFKRFSFGALKEAIEDEHKGREEQWALRMSWMPYWSRARIRQRRIS